MLGMAELSTSPCLLLSAARHSINPITITHQPRLATKHGDNIHLVLPNVPGEGPPTWAFSLLKVSSSTFAIKNLLRHYAKLALKHKEER